jgi:hypothetical protein
LKPFEVLKRDVCLFVSEVPVADVLQAYDPRPVRRVVSGLQVRAERTVGDTTFDR